MVECGGESEEESATRSSVLIAVTWWSLSVCVPFIEEILVE